MSAPHATHELTLSDGTLLDIYESGPELRVVQIREPSEAVVTTLAGMLHQYFPGTERPDLSSYLELTGQSSHRYYPVDGGPIKVVFVYHESGPQVKELIFEGTISNKRAYPRPALSAR